MWCDRCGGYPDPRRFLEGGIGRVLREERLVALTGGVRSSVCRYAGGNSIDVCGVWMEGGQIRPDGPGEV